MQQNIINGFYTNDGIQVEDIKDCDYVQIKLETYLMKQLDVPIKNVKKH